MVLGPCVCFAEKCQMKRALKNFIDSHFMLRLMQIKEMQKHKQRKKKQKTEGGAHPSLL